MYQLLTLFLLVFQIFKYKLVHDVFNQVLSRLVFVVLEIRAVVLRIQILPYDSQSTACAVIRVVAKQLKVFEEIGLSTHSCVAPFKVVLGAIGVEGLDGHTLVDMVYHLSRGYDIFELNHHHN